MARNLNFPGCVGDTQSGALNLYLSKISLFSQVFFLLVAILVWYIKKKNLAKELAKNNEELRAQKDALRKSKMSVRASTAQKMDAIHKMPVERLKEIIEKGGKQAQTAREILAIKEMGQKKTSDDEGTPMAQKPVKPETV